MPLMPADLVIFGTVLTVDDANPPPRRSPWPTAGSSRSATEPRSTELDRAGTDVVELGDGCVMPGFVEAHGHPLMEAIVLSDRIVDIRPVTIRDADDVVAAIRREVAERGADGRVPQRLGPAAAERPARADAGVARRRRARHPAGDHPQLRAQGVLQLRRRPRSAG